MAIRTDGSNRVTRHLAAAFLGGKWSLEALILRGAEVFGKRERFLRPLARRLLARFPEKPPGFEMSVAALEAHIAGDRAFRRFVNRSGGAQLVWIRRLFRVAPAMAPTPWPVPSWPTTTALADSLGIDIRALEWLADRHGFEARLPSGKLRHYHYAWLTTAAGKARLLEKPKSRLKMIQRRILREVLEAIPPHEAAHGYRRGRSVVSYVSPHSGQEIVLRFDLRDFFPSVRASRVHALFHAAGYPSEVCRLLTGLCTNTVPLDVLNAVPNGDLRQRIRARGLFSQPHLPQGAPTSPAIANLCAHRLDCRLAGLAASVGALYTRYADDLAFSGGSQLERSAGRFQVLVCRIALEEGFEVHTRKSRFMRQGVRQQLAGVVLNSHPNLPREELDRLKAILHNCARHGPGPENRDGLTDFRAHLRGRIDHVSHVNPARGAKLRAMWERIDWEGEGSGEGEKSDPHRQ